MQVLVALAMEPGQVLSRDDLIALCWDGRIVGDNAINRVISLLRQGLADVTRGAVRLETITKVGFRLLVSPPDNTEGGPQADLSDAGSSVSRFSRRATLVTAGAAMIGAGMWWWRPEAVFGHQPDPRAVDLFERGQFLQKTAEPGTMEQAISFYKQAIAIDPDYAAAWGALAVGYRHGLEGFSKRDREAAEKLARSAARKTLELDPENADADAAEIMFNPRFGRFPAAEAELRGLVSRHPDYWYGLGQLGIFLREMGRFRESFTITRRQLEIDPMLPVAWAFLSEGYGYAGDLEQSDWAMDQAVAKWPASGVLYSVHIDTLLETGRFAEAAAVARDVRRRPDYVPAQVGNRRAALAESLAGSTETDRSSFIAEMNAAIASDIRSAGFLAPRLAQLGAVDEAFASLKTYFDAASRSDDPAFRPRTMSLLGPVLLTFRNDPRHADLLVRSGLEDYWRLSGSQPDFRRG